MVVFPREYWAKLHLQFIYFGREHCQVRDGRHTTYASRGGSCTESLGRREKHRRTRLIGFLSAKGKGNRNG